MSALRDTAIDFGGIQRMSGHSRVPHAFGLGARHKLHRQRPSQTAPFASRGVRLWPCRRLGHFKAVAEALIFLVITGQAREGRRPGFSGPMKSTIAGSSWACAISCVVAQSAGAS